MVFLFRFLWVYSLVLESGILPYFMDCAIFTNARVGNIHRWIFIDARVGNIRGWS